MVALLPLVQWAAVPRWPARLVAVRRWLVRLVAVPRSVAPVVRARRSVSPAVFPLPVALPSPPEPRWPKAFPSPPVPRSFRLRVCPLVALRWQRRSPMQAACRQARSRRRRARPPLAAPKVRVAVLPVHSTVRYFKLPPPPVHLSRTRPARPDLPVRRSPMPRRWRLPQVRPARPSPKRWFRRRWAAKRWPRQRQSSAVKEPEPEPEQAAAVRLRPWRRSVAAKVPAVAVPPVAQVAVALLRAAVVLRAVKLVELQVVAPEVARPVAALWRAPQCPRPLSSKVAVAVAAVSRVAAQQVVAPAVPSRFRQRSRWQPRPSRSLCLRSRCRRPRSRCLRRVLRSAAADPVLRLRPSRQRSLRRCPEPLREA
ncbi:hypothetical protein FHU31_003946 [Mycolicibacterium fluoranthenivorans]|uniref:Uncharacterized protein n=1 Tax=Mycolicibacterium fluoranthenivorans TaxID=258505 RepID=A0A7X5ZEA9_9MYCO|nr:hypothetical protein [Mycolicibacterium fluoranthenivorans]NIH96956.1 hypothetical protein [Mycolicibacterium fluoranthenivorans]